MWNRGLQLDLRAIEENIGVFEDLQFFADGIGMTKEDDLDEMY